MHIWRRHEEWDARIMAALIGWGYKASDIERSLLPTHDGESEAPHKTFAPPLPRLSTGKRGQLQTVKYKEYT